MNVCSVNIVKYPVLYLFGFTTWAARTVC